MMGLLDSYFNAGESAGMPTKRGLLDDPLMQLGLGILANSQGNSFGTALGKGGLQASQALMQNKQFAQSKLLQDLQMKEAQQKLDQSVVLQKAKDAFKLAHPEYADAIDIDPSLAIKATYPQIGKNEAQPYFTPLSTENGIGSFDNRTGKFEIVTGADGNPYVKASDSPSLQGEISGAKSYGSGLFKTNTDMNGVLSTDSQISMAANPALASLPYVLSMNKSKPSSTPTPASFPKVTPQEQSKRDDVRMKILLDEQNQAGGAGKNTELDKEITRLNGLGIKIPTKAELDRASQDQKNASDLNYAPQIDAAKKAETMKSENKTQAQIDLPTTIANAQNTSRQIDELIGSADGKIKPHKGFTTAVGLSSKLDPRNYIAGTDATDFNVRLDQLKGGQFLQAFNSLKGGGSITEIEGKKATDAIARMNSASSEDEFIKAAREYQNIINSGVERAKLKAGATNNQPQTNTKPSKTVVKTGLYGGKKVVQYSDGSIEYAN